MPRYDAYLPQSPTLSPQKGWIVTALTGSLVVHAGLFIFFHAQKLENFGLTEPPPAKPEQVLQRVKIYEEKKKKPDEIKAVVSEMKVPPKKELILPKEQMKPDEIAVGTHRPLDTKALFGAEKPTIEMAKVDTAPRSNIDSNLPKLPDSMFAERSGPKIVAAPASSPGPDGDGTMKAIQVAGQDVEGILSGLSAGTGSARRLSLPGNLTFAYDSADISQAGRVEMEKIAEAFRKYLGDELSTATFIIEGHSDPTGTPEYNLRLSERRAESVRSWFITALGLDPGKVQTVGYGATRPVDGAPLSGTVEEMQVHRRTEIIVRRAKPQ